MFSRSALVAFVNQGRSKGGGIIPTSLGKSEPPLELEVGRSPVHSEAATGWGRVRQPPSPFLFPRVFWG